MSDEKALKKHQAVNSQTAARIEELTKLLNNYSSAYYQNNHSQVSDQDYDKLYRELERLESEHPHLRLDNSPTNRVGSSPLQSFETVPHLRPMLSLDNALNQTELSAYYQRVRKLLLADIAPKKLPDQQNEDELPLPDVSHTVEYKFDGVACSIIYRAGQLERAATRGDGINGENVTENIRTIRSVPLSLNQEVLAECGLTESVIEIRGEVLFLQSDFALLNQRETSAGRSEFANARNAASGTLRQLDSAVTAERPLTFFAYSINLAGNEELLPMNNLSRMELISRFGFKVSELLVLAEDEAALLAAFAQGEVSRADLNFEADGVVCKVNEIAKQNKLGFKQRSPRWAIAGKFSAASAQTRLLTVTFQVGRTGVVTPVAELASVKLGGVIISRATLHNIEDIERKGIKLGDQVVVKRQGDVIPAVTGFVSGSRSGNECRILFPSVCPECAATLIQSEAQVAIICPNLSCPAQVVSGIAHYCSKKAADIDGCGERTIRQLNQAGLIGSLPDLFKLDPTAITALPGWQAKSTEKLLAAIEESKEISLSRFIYGMGIPHIGTKSAAVLAVELSSLLALGAATAEQLSEIPDIGPTTALTVSSFMEREYQTVGEDGIIDQLIKNGVAVLDDTSGASFSDSELSGAKIVITGTFTGYSRDQLGGELSKLGAKVQSSLSAKTDYLFCGDNAGSKLRKAQDLGTKIVYEPEALELLGLK